MNLVFWKKQKHNKKIMSCKEAGVALKSAANAIVQDFSIEINPVEIVMLMALISHLDKFILKCFDGDKLIHHMWICARLMEIKIVLKPSSSREIKTIVKMIDALEKLIYAEKERNGKKRT